MEEGRVAKNMDLTQMKEEREVEEGRREQIKTDADVTTSSNSSKQVHTPQMDDTPRGLLQILVDIGEFTVPLGQNFIDNVAGSVQYDIWTLTTNNPNIAQVFEFNYTIYRADLEIIMTVKGTPYSWGAVIVNVVWTDDIDYYFSVYSIIDMDPYVLDISESGTHIIDVPYINYERFWDFYRTEPQITPYLIFTPVSNGSIVPQTNPPTITIQARIKQIKMSGATSQMYAPRQVGRAQQVGRFLTKIENEDEADAMFQWDDDNIEQQAAGDNVAADSYQVESKAWGYNNNMNKSKPPQFDKLAVKKYSGDYAPGPAKNPIKNIMQIPTIYNAFQMTKKGDNNTILVAPLVNATRMTNIDRMACMFRHWRGEIEYRFYFYTSPLVTARFLLTYYSPIPGKTNYKGRVFKRYIDVHGTTYDGVSLPYIQTTDWMTIRANWEEPGYEWNLRLEMITEIMAPEGTPGISIIITQCAGKSFQVRGLVGITSQMRLHKRKPVESITQEHNIYPQIPEDMLTIENILNAQSVQEPQITPDLAPQIIQPWTRRYQLLFNEWEWLTNMFAFQSGEINYKLVWKLISTTEQSPEPVDWREIYMASHVTFGSTIPTYPGINGTQRSNVRKNNTMTVSYPLIAETEWVPTSLYGNDKNQGLSPITVTSKVGDNIEISQSAGRNYRLLFLQPPYTHKFNVWTGAATRAGRNVINGDKVKRLQDFEKKKEKGKEKTKK